MMHKFALIGYPLAHSLSDVIHQAGFKSLGIDGKYSILETPPETLVSRIKFLKLEGYEGFNVTIPLKIPISLFVDEFDAYADLAGAINTVTIMPDKSLKAYNTDVLGFRRAIPADFEMQGAKAAILGTGGASHAAVVALADMKVAAISLFTRNIPNSIEVVNYFRRKFPSIVFEIFQIENIRDLSEYKMVVNATPIGMLGHSADMMPLSIEALRTIQRNAILYDIVYNPIKTRMIKCAEDMEIRTISGLDMLLYQAVCAQEIWFGRTPDFDKMKIAALENL
ncbi:MAG: shikimate dehydrogenase [Clostridiaceae bacterium]|jgi:shikimate dehydrogenase|nr:shikimate dehydrogenase [Clostridiaceae bacterium]